MVCGQDCACTLCSNCQNQLPTSILILLMRVKESDNRDSELQMICYNCCEHNTTTDLFASTTLISSESCQSLDCNVFYERCRTIARREHRRADIIEVYKLNGQYFEFTDELKEQLMQQLFDW